MPVLMFGSFVQNEVRIIDLFSAVVGVLMNSSKLSLLISKEAQLNSGVRLLLELFCVIIKASSMLPSLVLV